MSKESKNESEINKFMLASSNNTIFIDFHCPNFKENFYLSKHYLYFNKNLSENEINERAKILRERANDILLSNKIFG